MLAEAWGQEVACVRSSGKILWTELAEGAKDGQAGGSLTATLVRTRDLFCTRGKATAGF